MEQQSNIKHKQTTETKLTNKRKPFETRFVKYVLKRNKLETSEYQKNVASFECASF